MNPKVYEHNALLALLLWASNHLFFGGPREPYAVALNPAALPQDLDRDDAYFYLHIASVLQ